MIHHYQQERSLLETQKSPKSRIKSTKTNTTTTTTGRKQRLITTKLDTELLNQIDFLAQHLEIKKVEILRQLVKKKIQTLGLWNQYLSSPKKY
jgi:hypothetical protein